MTSSPARPTSHYHRLITLGRLTLLRPDGAEDPSLGTRRRKLAVLAYLALRPRPATRDHLAALFWGGKDDERARNSLSDALSHLRRVLGRHSIVTRGEEVALATDAPLVVDALEFIEAAGARDWTRATSLYGGPFLDGVHIDDAPEFDQWCTSEGRRLQRVFSRACAPHARALAAEGRWDACSDVAARWLATEPASAEAALYRLNALKAPGTNGALTAALDEYERLRARLAEELGVGLDPAVQELAASIRADLPPVLPEPSAPSVATPLPHTDAEARREVRRDGSPHIAPVAATAARAAWPRIGTRLGVLLATLMVIIGAAAYGSRHSAKDSRVILAVLPFENVGAPGDAYFADGLTDEVRARLTALSGLQVIGGASARQYRGTTKPPREIARELGATHLLTGSVRWQRSPDGRGSVRVSVELVHAADQANVWAEPVEGPLDEIFAMQAQVAARVASALDVRLLAKEGSEMAARPTTNLAAYDAYLRGRASISSATRFSAADRRATLEEFERAVALDPKFAAAHAQIAWAHLRDYEQAGDPTAAAAALAKFRAAAEQAWALDSTLVDTRLVRARYLESAGDFSAATLLVRTMARAAPGNVEVLGVLGETEERSGRREAAVAAYRQAMALDPRAVEAWVSFAGLLDGSYRHEEAIAVREHEIELTPNSDVAYAVQASSHLLARGDTAAARRTLERGSRTLPWVVRLPGGVAGITIWERVLPPSVLSARDTLTLPGYLAGAGGIAPELYYLVKLRHFQARGRVDRARAYADSLVARLVPAVRAGGDAPWFFWWFSRRSVLAEAFANLQRNAEAARETDDYVSETRRRVTSPGLAQGELCHALHNAAYVDVLVGRRDSAVARLREAFDLPCGSRVSRALLRVDPAWAPLRGHPAFERLIGGGPEVRRRS